GPARGVSATAGVPSPAAWSASCSGANAPSSKEKEARTSRWTKPGSGMVCLAREVQRRFVPPLRPRSVPGAVPPVPAELGLRIAFDPPSVLVDELVMERTDQDEVVQVGPAAVPPEADVMRLGERRGPAAGEPAAPVAVA